MRLGYRAFFYAGHAADVMRYAIALARFYQCSPFEFLDRPNEEILTLHEETLIFVREMKLR